MILNDYDMLIKENFNLFDAPTRRMIVALEDGEQTQMLNALSNSLYNKITSDMNKIDFGSIPRSRGDITKVEKFEDTEECLVIMKKLVQEYRQDTVIVDTVLEAVDNVKQRRALFAKGFATNNALVMSIYNLNVLAIEESVSFLISVCIQYIKDPQTKTMSMALDQVSYYNTKNNVIYEQLLAFNESCANGNMDKVLNNTTPASKLKESYEDIAIIARVDGEPDKEVDMSDPVQPNIKDVPNPNADVVQEEEPEIDSIGNTDAPVASGDDISSEDIAVNDRYQNTNESILGTAASIATGAKIAFGITAAAVMLTPIIIKGLRCLVYFFINTALSFTAIIEVQANLIEMNAYTLQTSDYVSDGIDDAKRAKIVRKQLNIANKMKKLSNKMMMLFNKSDKKTRERLKKEEKKYTAEELKDDLSADIYNKSVLF